MKTLKKNTKVLKERLPGLISKKLRYVVALPEWKTDTATLKKSIIKKRNKFQKQKPANLLLRWLGTIL
jgi:hypothetical protein